VSQAFDRETWRWMARRRSVLVLEILRGNTTVSESSRRLDLIPSEIEG
jgi:hypothetical protein